MDLIQRSLGGEVNQRKTVYVDLFVERASGEQFLFDLKTIKPNVSSFKRTLLEWAWVVFTQSQKADPRAFIAIPYNPYIATMPTWDSERNAGLTKRIENCRRFCDFFSGLEPYSDLLDCFEEVGIVCAPTSPPRNRPIL